MRRPNNVCPRNTAFISVEMASFVFRVAPAGVAPAGLLLLLYVGGTGALMNGNPVGSSSDVPGVTGSLFRMATADEASMAATCTSGDEGIVPFCTVALISPGIVLTAAHCVQEQITAGDPSAFGNLRVSLVRAPVMILRPAKPVTREARNPRSLQPAKHQT